MAILFLFAPLLSSFGSVEGTLAGTEEAAASCCHFPVDESPSEDEEGCCSTIPTDDEPCSSEQSSCDSEECECRTVSAGGFLVAPVEFDALSLGTAEGKLSFPRVERPHDVSPQALGKVPKV